MPRNHNSDSGLDAFVFLAAAMGGVRKLFANGINKSRLSKLEAILHDDGCESKETE